MAQMVLGGECLGGLKNERHLHPNQGKARSRSPQDDQGGNDHLHYYDRPGHYDNHCRYEVAVMVLDSEFLIYAIQQKQDQQKVNYSTKTRDEITILKRRLTENESLHSLPSIPIAER